MHIETAALAPVSEATPAAPAAARSDLSARDDSRRRVAALISRVALFVAAVALAGVAFVRAWAVGPVEAEVPAATELTVTQNSRSILAESAHGTGSPLSEPSSPELR